MKFDSQYHKRNSFCIFYSSTMRDFPLEKYYKVYFEKKKSNAGPRVTTRKNRVWMKGKIRMLQIKERTFDWNTRKHKVQTLQHREYNHHF